MFCSKCGKEFSDYVQFCPECGAAAAKEKDEIAQMSEEPAETTENNEQPVSGEVTEDAATYEDAENEIPSIIPKEPEIVKSKHIGTKLAIAIPAVILALLIAFNFSGIYGFFLRNFGSGKSYMKYVEDKAFSNGFCEMNNNFRKNLNDISDPNKSGTAVETKIELSDKLQSMLSSLSTTDFSWAKSISANGDVSFKDGKMAYDLDMLINEKKISSLTEIMDIKNGKIYVSLPDLAKKSISLDLKQGDNEEATAMLTAFESIFSDDSILKSLPKSSKTNKLLQKYYNLIFSEIGDVTKSSEKLTIGNVSNSYTALKANLTDTVLTKMAKSILTTAKNDKELESYIKDNIKNFAEVITNASGKDIDEKEIYDTFITYIDSALKSLEGYSSTDTTIATLTDYVNSSNEIIGRNIEVSGAKIYYYTIENGSKIAFKAGLNDEITLAGSGTKKHDKITGDFVINAYSTEYGTVSLKDFNVSAIKDGTMSGTISIKPSSELISTLAGSQVSSVIGAFDPKLQITLDANKEKFDAAISILSGNDEYIKMSIKAKRQKSKAITVPDESNTVSADNNNAMSEWAKEIDFSKLAGILKEAGVPSSYTDMIVSAAAVY